MSAYQKKMERLYTATVSKARPLVLEKPISGSRLVYLVKEGTYDFEGSVPVIALQVFDLAYFQDYAYLPESKRFHEDLTIGPLYVGELNVKAAGQVTSTECIDDFILLKEAAQYAGLPFGKVFHVMWSFVCNLDDGDEPRYCERGYRRKGLGKAMYATMMGLLAATGRVNVLVADTCIGSATSTEARRVYPVLLRTFVGKGLVISSVPSASPQGKALAQSLKAVQQRHQTSQVKRGIQAVMVRSRTGSRRAVAPAKAQAAMTAKRKKAARVKLMLRGAR